MSRQENNKSEKAINFAQEFNRVYYGSGDITAFLNSEFCKEFFVNFKGSLSDFDLADDQATPEELSMYKLAIQEIYRGLIDEDYEMLDDVEEIYSKDFVLLRLMRSSFIKDKKKENGSPNFSPRLMSAVNFLEKDDEFRKLDDAPSSDSGTFFR